MPTITFQFAPSSIMIKHLSLSFFPPSGTRLSIIICLSLSRLSTRTRCIQDIDLSLRGLLTRNWCIKIIYVSLSWLRNYKLLKHLNMFRWYSQLWRYPNLFFKRMDWYFFAFPLTAIALRYCLKAVDMTTETQPTIERVKLSMPCCERTLENLLTWVLLAHAQWVLSAHIE